MRIDDAILSGSVVGSAATVSLTGSFTGSGFITSASYGITASYALNVESFNKNYPIQTYTTNFNLSKDNYHVITAAITGTLPAGPANGDRLGIINLGTNEPLIARNGSNIMGQTQDLSIDSNNASFQLVYSGATNGWVFIGANN
jgi:hypothetical protein